MHEELTAQFVKIEKQGTKAPRIKCIFCQREADKRYWHRHKEEKKEYRQEWIEENLLTKRQQDRKYEAFHRKHLSDRYVCRKIIGEGGIKKRQIPPSLIEFKRAVLQLKREIKIEQVDKEHSAAKRTRDSNLRALEEWRD